MTYWGDQLAYKPHFVKKQSSWKKETHIFSCEGVPFLYVILILILT